MHAGQTLNNGKETRSEVQMSEKKHTSTPRNRHRNDALHCDSGVQNAKETAGPHGIEPPPCVEASPSKNITENKCID